MIKALSTAMGESTFAGLITIPAAGYGWLALGFGALIVAFVTHPTVSERATSKLVRGQQANRPVNLVDLVSVVQP